LKEEALSIQTAVSESMNAGIVTEDLAGTSTKSYHTDNVGEWIVEWIKSH
jgi:isocitrate/isopropylmalate dehydrogenase